MSFSLFTIKVINDFQKKDVFRFLFILENKSDKIESKRHTYNLFLHQILFICSKSSV